MSAPANGQQLARSFQYGRSVNAGNWRVNQAALSARRLVRFDYRTGSADGSTQNDGRPFSLLWPFLLARRRRRSVSRESADTRTTPRAGRNLFGICIGRTLRAPTTARPRLHTRPNFTPRHRIKKNATKAWRSRKTKWRRRRRKLHTHTWQRREKENTTPGRRLT